MSEREKALLTVGYNDAVRDIAKAMRAIASEPGRLPTAKAMLEQFARGVEAMMR